MDTREEQERGLTPEYSKGVFQAVCVAGENAISFFPAQAAVSGAAAVSEIIEGKGYRVTPKLSPRLCRWTLTVFFPFAGLKQNNYIPGEEFNLDIGINDADKGKRKLQMMFSGTDRNWGDSRYFARMSPAR